jgi:hypothetical protein
MMGRAATRCLPVGSEFVCQNGLITGTTSEDLRVRHSGNAIEQVIDGAYQVLGNSDVVTEQRREMAALQLSSGEQRAFARAAMDYRFADAVEADRPMPVEPDQVLEARRYDDAGADLWSTFNRVQENLVQGGLRKRANPRRREHTRAVTGVDGNVNLNRALWRLAEEMRAIKSGAIAA